MKSISVLLLLLFCLVIFAMTAVVAQAQVQSWDNRIEFSVENNPNNAWTYGYLDKEGNFTEYNSSFSLGDGIVGWAMNDDPDSSGNITVNTSSKMVEKFGIVWEPNQMCLHPGLFGCKAVLRWTSPVSGSVSINISVAGKSKHGAPANIEIKHKSESVANGAVKGFAGSGTSKCGRFGDMPEISFSPTFSVNKGDTVDIVVSGTKTGVTGHIAVNAVISAGGKG